MARETVSVRTTIKRRGFESLGCNNREMITAAREKYGENIDFASRHAADGNEEVKERYENIGVLFGESVIRSNGEIKNDRLINGDTCIDLGVIDLLK